MRSITKWVKSVCDTIKRFYKVISYRKALSACDTAGYREAYVCFISTKLVWVQYFLKPGFQHCIIIYKLESGALLVNFKVNKADIITLTDSAYDRYLAICLNKGGHILKVRNRSPKAITGFVPTLWKPNNCVLLVKNMLGIKANTVWTPYQLYKHIKENYEYKEV